jgi:hypothetical protein
MAFQRENDRKVQEVDRVAWGLPLIGDPELEREVAEFQEIQREAIFRMATEDRRYPDEFMEGVERREFRNPDTGNRIKFVSLPPAEQRRLYQQWRSRKTPAQQLAPRVTKKMPQGQRHAVLGLGHHRNFDLPTAHKTLGGKKKEVLGVLESLTMSGVLSADEGGWGFTDLGKEVHRTLSREYGQHVPATPKTPAPRPEYPTPPDDEGTGGGGDTEYDFPGPDLGRTIEDRKTASEDRGGWVPGGVKISGGPGPKNSRGAAAQDTGHYKAFVSAMEGQTFRHPGTGNRVKFVSLPQQEQKRIYQRWSANQQRLSPSQRVSMDIQDWNFTKDSTQHEGPSRDRFLQEMAHQKFRNPVTGNPVQFQSLPSQEQERVFKTWSQQQGAQSQRDHHDQDRVMIEQAEARGDMSGMGHDDVRQRAGLDEEWFEDLPTDGEAIGGAYAMDDWETEAEKGEQESVFAMHHEDDGEHMAAYSDDFMREVSGKMFRHPDTGNQVQFNSLPSREQKQVYQQWSSRQQPQGEQPQALPGLEKYEKDDPAFAKRVREVQEQHGRELTPKELSQNYSAWKHISDKEKEQARSPGGRDQGQTRTQPQAPGDVPKIPRQSPGGGRGQSYTWPKEHAPKPQRKQVGPSVSPKRPSSPDSGPMRPGQRSLPGIDKKHPLNRTQGIVRQDAQKFLEEVEEDENFHDLPVPEQVQAFADWAIERSSAPPETKRKLRQHDDEAMGPVRERDFERRRKKYEEEQAGRGKIHEDDQGKPVSYGDLPAAQQRQMFMQDQYERDASLNEHWGFVEDNGVLATSDEMNWGFIEADAHEARMEDYASLPFAPAGPTPGAKMHGPRGMMEDSPEPPPPSEIRRMLQDNMRDMGRTLMISGMKAPLQQMLAIGATMDGLLDQLNALADQPGRKGIQRRLLQKLRPKVMNPGR